MVAAAVMPRRDMKIRLLTATGSLLAVAALLLGGGSSAAARTIAAHPPAPAGAASHGGHRRLCAGPCRFLGPVKQVHAPRHVRYPAPSPLAEVPAGSWGFDMNGNGCSGSSFEAGAAPADISGASGLAFDSVQLNGWGWADMYADDPCFNAQVQWYQQNDAGKPIQFIMFPVPYDSNYCNSYSTSTSDGYNAGYGQAQMIYGKAVSAGLPVSGGMWWLDVEQTADCGGWNYNVPGINLSVIQGVVAFLHSKGLTVGIYTDLGDWNAITNSNKTQFAGIPAWNANPYYENPYVTVYNNSGQNINSLSSVKSWAQAICGQAGFTGGPTTVVQYMWGNSSEPYYQTNVPPAILGRDFDYTCKQIGGPPLAADDPSGGPAVVHDGYTSVYTVNADHSLEETYLAANGQRWNTQNMATGYGTPLVAAGTTPVALFHDGYTSVYTINAADHTLQETYLSALGQRWATQNLSAKAGTPPVAAHTTPAVVYHGGYVSVFTVNASGHTLQETYLSALGQQWHTQSLSVGAGTPVVAKGSSPAGLFHTGYTSVFTVNAAGHTLQETYLSAIGQQWHTQSLSGRFGTPPVAGGSSPAPVLHTDASGNLDFTSVYTVNAAGHTLQETYLPAIGDSWVTQSLSAGSNGTPPVAAGATPVALYHTGYTSVYTINASGHTLQETYLPVNGGPWHTQSLSAGYGTPPVAARTSPAAVVHPDSSGVIDFTSVYTINAAGHTLQETYLPAIGDRWTTKTLPTPPIAVAARKTGPAASAGRR
jgi:hypothetical protein